MKRLMLMRHAKSSWGDESLPDFERPLNERGDRDAPRIGRELVARNAMPDVIVTSTAVRAMQTVKLLCEQLGPNALAGVQQVPSLYGASEEQILETAKSLPDFCSRALLVGHNPGMGELLATLTGEPNEMKTATVACIAFDTKRWEEIEDAEGGLEWILYPGKLAE